MRRLPQKLTYWRQVFAGIRQRLKARKRRYFASQLTPFTFRQLEPRRVLSVNATFAGGILDVAVTDNSQAALLAFDPNEFFVDEDGGRQFDIGELKGALASLNSVNVTDASNGSFFWGDTFSVLSANIQIGSAEFDGNLVIQNNLVVNAQQDVLFSGALNVVGDLTIGSATQQVTNADGAQLQVGGVAQLDAVAIDLGQKAGDTVLFGSISANNAATNLTLEEDVDNVDLDTVISGSNTVASLNIKSAGSIYLNAGAAITATTGVTLDANGLNSDLQVDGTINSNSGAVSLSADDHIGLGTNGQISTTTGNVLLTANADGLDGNDDDGIVMDSGSSIAVGNARIQLSSLGNSGGSIALSHLVSASALNNSIEVNSAADITDNTAAEPVLALNDPAVNLSALNGTVVLSAMQGAIGAGNEIDVDVLNLVFNTGGVIQLTDTQGGLTISQNSSALGGGSIAANSPLTISANVNVGASTTFTAGDSNLAGDNLTIDSGAVVRLDSAIAGKLTFNAGDDIRFNSGSVITAGNPAHEVELSADRDHAGVGALDGDRGSITEDGSPFIEVRTNNLIASAATGITLDTDVDSATVAVTATGDVTIRDQGDITLTSVATANGSINVSATGQIVATLVNAAGAGSNVILVGTAIDANSVTAANNISLTATTGNITSGTVTATAGSLVAAASAGNVIVGSMTAGATVSLAAGGTIRGITDDGVADISAGASVIMLSAGTGISGAGGVGRLDLAAGSQVTASSTTGPINLDGLGALTLTSVTAGNGSVDARAVGLLAATLVSTIGTDSNSNSISLTSTSDSVSARSVQAGPAAGDVTITAQLSIIDGDTIPDDLDISGNDVTLTAVTGNIGSVTGDIFTGSASALEVSATGNLTASAGGGLIALDPAVGGTLTLNTVTAWLQSNGNLDVATAVFNVQNLALIADADNNGTGTLTLAPTLSVPSDLRVEGADVVASDGSIDLAANRLLFSSGRAGFLPLQNEAININVRQLDGSATGNLSVSSTSLLDLELIDLNLNNIALRTQSTVGSISLSAVSTVIVSDDVIAGNDGTTASLGTVSITATGANSDIFVNDVILTDRGDIALSADNDIRFRSTPTVNEPATIDDLPVITSIDGIITLTADENNDANGAGGALFMNDVSRVIAGRDATVDYLAGTNGNASPTPIALGNIAKSVGAEIHMSADESLTLAFVESASNTALAISLNSISGSIVDGSDVGGSANIIANNAGALVTMRAVTGIGSADALETEVFAVDVLNADNGLQVASGHIRLREIVTGGSLNVVQASNQADIGDVILRVDAGNLVVVSGAFTPNNGLFGVATEQGNILLESLTSDVITSSLINSIAGNVTLQAADDVLVNANVVTDAKSIFVTAGNIVVDGVGLDGIVMSDNTRMQSFAGVIRLDARANSDIFLGLLDTVNADESAGTVSLLAGRSVLAGPGDLAELNIDTGRLRIIADVDGLRTGSIGLGDPLNGATATNLNAINTRVQTLAAQSSRGIYIEEANGLTITSVGLAAARRVNFDSSLTDFSDAVLSDLLTTDDGPIKIVSGGPVVINDGDADGFGVEAMGNADILLQATAGDIDVNARIVSGTGNISIIAADDIRIFAPVSTSGAGSIYMSAANSTADAGASLQISGAVSTGNGHIYLTSTGDIDVAATIASTNGSIGLATTGLVNQAANITSIGGDVLIIAGPSFTMVGGAEINANNAIVIVSSGDQILGRLDAQNAIALEAGGSIIDGNGAALNINAQTFSARAGGSIGTSDLFNLPNSNNNAIDLTVDTVAAQAGGSIYLLQLAARPNLSIGHANALTANVSAQQVHFNSTRSAIGASRTAAPADDLTAGGPVKVVVELGDLTVGPGTDGDGLGIEVLSAQDVLLEARNGDLITEPNSGVESNGGHITLFAADDVVLGASVATDGIGTIFVRAENQTADGLPSGVDGIDVSGEISSADGDILLRSLQDIRVASDIQTATGNVGLIADRDVLQTADISAGGSIGLGSGNVVVSAARHVTMTAGAETIATSTVLVDIGGTLTLGLLQADQVALNATLDILDGNDVLVPVSNLRARELRMTAGGTIGDSDLANADVNANANAIDTEVDFVAARAGTGIYLEELAAGIGVTVGHVAAATTQALEVQRVEFRSTTSLVIDVARALSALDDLETTNNGAIKVVVDAGSLTIIEGDDNDNVGVRAHGSGDILLHARGPASDVILESAASVSSGTGHITVHAADDLVLGSSIATGGFGTIYLRAENQTTGAAVDGIDVSSAMSSSDGDILLRSLRDIRVAADIQTATANIGLVAAGDVFQFANITAGGSLLLNQGNVIVSTGGDVTMALGAQTIATSTILVDSGDAVTLGLLQADRVALNATGDILDGNDALITAVNVLARELQMRAGGIIGGDDSSNLLTTANAKAIDLVVDTVAAQAVLGIYLQELAVGGELIVGHVEGVTTQVMVREVEFRSTTANLTEARVLAPLDDLEIPDAGVIKVMVEAGTLRVTEGDDDDDIGVRAAGSGNILLRAIGAASDVITELEAGVRSGSGHITIHANDDVVLAAEIASGGSGTVYLRSENQTVDAIPAGIDGIDVGGGIVSADGDILLQSLSDIRIAANIQTTTGDVGLFAVRDVLQSAIISAGGSLMSGQGNVVVSVGRDVVMGPLGQILATNTILVDSLGTLTLGLLQADRVALVAGGDILDGNETPAPSTNVRARQLQMTAGGAIGASDPVIIDPSVNARSIDLEVGTVAARARTGIYLQELASGGNLIIGNVAAVSTQITVEQVDFRSTVSPVSDSESLAALDDLETTNNGVIKVVVDAGNLAVTDGLDADGFGVTAHGTGDLTLQTKTIGSITLDTGIRAAANITLKAFSFIDETSDRAAVVGNPVTTLLTITAGTHAHLHDVSVAKLTAVVGRSEALQLNGATWQTINTNAADEGVKFIDRLAASGVGNTNGVLTGANNLVGVHKPISDLLSEYDFRKYNDRYSLFLVNSSTLEVQNVTAGKLSDAADNQPNIYIETRASGDLRVPGAIKTVSNTAEEGGVVLVSAGELKLTGTIETQQVAAIRQLVKFIDMPQLVAVPDEVRQTLRGNVFDAGQGIGSELTTKTVLSNARSEVGPTFFGEQDPLRLVLQRVVMQFGAADEEGFSVFVGYADGEVQEFNTQGEVGRPTNLSADPSAIDAKPVPVNTAVFTRATAFDQQYLFSDPTLETIAVMRRSSDFFFFDSPGPEGTFRDLTFEAHNVEGVLSDGAQGGGTPPVDPRPLQGGTPTLVPVTVLIQTPTQQINNLPEIQSFVQRNVEVAVYRVSFDDLNENGQVEQDELPTTEEVQKAEVVDEDHVDKDDAEDEPGEHKRKRARIKQLEIESGGTASPEDIDKFKAEFLNDPEQTSGAYSIIQKDTNDKETVLEIFSLRDWPEEQKTDQPVITPEGTTPEAGQKKADESAPKEDTGTEPVPPPETNDKNASLWQPNLPVRGKWETRLASASVLAGTLLMMRETSRGQSESLLQMMVDSNAGKEPTTSGFDRRARRLRRLRNDNK